MIPEDADSECIRIIRGTSRVFYADHVHVVHEGVRRAVQAIGYCLADGFRETVGLRKDGALYPGGCIVGSVVAGLPEFGDAVYYDGRILRRWRQGAR